MSDQALPADSPRRGLILINTGPGKGKTTAALGTAFRAAGNGMRVLFLQFLKGSWHYGELDAAETLNAALYNAVIPSGAAQPRSRGTPAFGPAETSPSRGAAHMGAPSLEEMWERTTNNEQRTTARDAPASEALAPKQAAENFSSQNFVIRQLGRGFVKIGGAETDPEDIRLVESAWAEAEASILSGEWDLVVLDEINYAIGYKMLAPERVAEVLRRKPEMTHVILTGRNAHPLLIELADTVTEMREVKHAYQRGILAQRGIEF